LSTYLAHTKLLAGVAPYFLNSTVLVLPSLFLGFLRLNILFDARNAMKRSVFLKTGNVIKWLWQLKLILVLEYFGAL